MCHLPDWQKPLRRGFQVASAAAVGDRPLRASVRCDPAGAGGRRPRRKGRPVVCAEAGTARAWRVRGATRWVRSGEVENRVRGCAMFREDTLDGPGNRRPRAPAACGRGARREGLRDSPGLAAGRSCVSPRAQSLRPPTPCLGASRGQQPHHPDTKQGECAGAAVMDRNRAVVGGWRLGGSCGFGQCYLGSSGSEGRGLQGVRVPGVGVFLRAGCT